MADAHCSTIAELSIARQTWDGYSHSRTQSSLNLEDLEHQHDLALIHFLYQNISKSSNASDSPEILGIIMSCSFISAAGSSGPPFPPSPVRTKVVLKRLDWALREIPGIFNTFEG